MDELISMVQDPNPAVQLEALTALSIMGPDAKEAIPVMIQALNHPSVQVRCAAATAIQSMGELAKDAIPSLTANLNPRGLLISYPPGLKDSPDFDHDAYRASQIAPLQLACAIALGKMGPEAKSALPALEQFTQESNTACGSVKDAIAKLKQ